MVNACNPREVLMSGVIGPFSALVKSLWVAENPPQPNRSRPHKRGGVPIWSGDLVLQHGGTAAQGGCGTGWTTATA